MKTLFGGVIGIAIALLIGVIVLQRYDKAQVDVPQPISTLLLLTAIGGFTGCAIASPVPEKSDRISKTSEGMK